MEDEPAAAEYREQLLKALQNKARRQSPGGTGRILVFVDQKRVGSLDKEQANATLHVHTRSRMHSVDVRSEDGFLLGGLYVGEHEFKRSRIPIGRDAIELEVQNYADSSSLSAVFQYAPSFWNRASACIGLHDHSLRHPGVHHIPWVTVLALTQVMLAVAITGLVGDRIFRWNVKPATVNVTSTNPSWMAPMAEVKKLEQQLSDLADMQAKAAGSLHAQQEGLADIRHAVAKLSTTQETVAASVVLVRKEIEKRQHDSGQALERMARTLISKAQDEQDELQAEISSLAVANDRLSKERSDLERTNQELKQRLKAAGVDISKATPSHAGSGDMAQPRPEVGATAQVADGSRTQDSIPFLFWVTFQEGTTEETIERWVQEMKGHKGSRSDGWQAVEINQMADPPDRFMNRVKDAKIVKAIRVSQ